MALPGLAKPQFNMPRATSIKADAGQSLRTQPRATGSGTRAAITSSVAGSTTGVGNTAKLNQSTTAGFFGMSFHGVTAQRSNRLIANVKAGYSNNIFNLRHALLDARRGYNVAPPPMPRARAAEDSYMNSYMKMMEIQAFTKSIGDVAAGGVALANVLKSGNANKTPKNEKPETPTKPTGSEVTGSNGNISSQLSSANTSKGLTDALTNLQNSIGPLETAIGENEGLINAEVTTQSEISAEINVANQELGGLMKDFATIQLQGGNTTEIHKQIIDKQNEISELNKKLEESKSHQQKLNEENEKLKGELADKKNEQLKYNSKLDTIKGQETNQLNKLKSELGKLSEKFNKEDKDDKKAKISTEYTAKAKEFNGILKNSIVEGFQQAGLSLT